VGFCALGKEGGFMRKFFPLLIGFLLFRLVNLASAQEAGGKPDSAMMIQP
jgi:hypothetical protein